MTARILLATEPYHRWREGGRNGKGRAVRLPGYLKSFDRYFSMKVDSNRPSSYPHGSTTPVRQRTESSTKSIQFIRWANKERKGAILSFGLSFSQPIG